MIAIIFTDGASRGNPGPGGWGAIVVENGEAIEIGGREDMTTNNRMELSAVIGALKQTKEKKVTVYTDSAYVLSGSTRWVFGWKKNNWKTSQKEDVLNRDLWEEMLKLVSKKSIEWKLLKGHSGIPGNERCDVIATAFADKKNIDLYVGSQDSYPVSLVAETSISAGIRPRKAEAFSYVSLVDGVVQVHKSWDECKKRVTGVSGARYKKSISVEDEQDIIQSFKQ